MNNQRLLCLTYFFLGTFVGVIVGVILHERMELRFRSELKPLSDYFYVDNFGQFRVAWWSCKNEEPAGAQISVLAHPEQLHEKPAAVRKLYNAIIYGEASGKPREFFADALALADSSRRTSCGDELFEFVFGKGKATEGTKFMYVMIGRNNKLVFRCGISTYCD